jgi:hypothetical protein
MQANLRAALAVVLPACVAAFALDRAWPDARSEALRVGRLGRTRAPVCSLRAPAATALRMGLDEELAAVSGMKVSEIKQELTQRGLATNDMFEKDEFVQRLAQARLRGDGAATGAASDAATPSPSPPASAHDREADIRAAVNALRVSEIKAQLSERGISTQGVFEKSTFVELLVKARLDSPEGSRGTGVPPPPNSEFKDVQTKKIPRKEAAEPTQSGARGSPFGAGVGVGGGIPNPFANMGGVIPPVCACTRDMLLIPGATEGFGVAHFVSSHIFLLPLSFPS